MENPEDKDKEERIKRILKDAKLIISFTFTPTRKAVYKKFLPLYIKGIEVYSENGQLKQKHPLRHLLMETQEGKKQLMAEYKASIKYFKDEGFKDLFFSHWENIPPEQQIPIKFK